MKLTGKCLKDFEKWFNKDIDNFENYDDWILNRFYRVHFSMQYGVYVDFFDSVGIYISDMIDCYYNKKGKPLISGFITGIEANKNHAQIDKNTRYEARTEAINKANEIYNRNNKA